jgi:hypothetical protein
MKCIKAVKASKKTEIGTILRIDNVEAEARVLSTYWSYISKSEWKAAQPKVAEVKVETGKEFYEKADKVITVKREETVSEKQLKRKKQK